MPSRSVYRHRYRKAADYCVVKLVTVESLRVPVPIDLHGSEATACGNHLATCLVIGDLIEDVWVSRRVPLRAISFA